MSESLEDEIVPLALESPSAIRASELRILHSILEQAHATIKLWAETPDTPENSVARRALFRDAVVQFMTCVGNNDRHKIPPADIYAKDSQWEPFYEWMKALRDYYAAHSHGAARLCDVCVVVRKDEPTKPVGTSYILAEVDGPGDKALTSMLDFFAYAANHIHYELERLHKVIWEEITLMSEDEISKLKPPMVDLPPPSDLRRTRKQHRQLQTERPLLSLKYLAVRKPEDKSDPRED